MEVATRNKRKITFHSSDGTERATGQGQYTTELCLATDKVSEFIGLSSSAMNSRPSLVLFRRRMCSIKIDR